MNTSLGYSKKTLTDSNVLLSGGGDKALSEFIGSLNWDSTNKKLQYKSASSTDFTDLITFGARAFDSTAYLPLTGGTLTGAFKAKKDLGGNLSNWNQKQHDGVFEVGRATNSMCVTIGVTDDDWGYIQCKGANIISNGKLAINPADGSTTCFAGKVGIATPNPSYRLDVNGSINGTSIYLNGTALNTASTHAHGDYVTAIGTNGNTLTWNKGGTAQTAITIPYATSAGSAANVTGVVAIANGGTGASTRLKALKNLTNENVSTNAEYFLTITTSWAKGGYTSVAQAKTILAMTGATSSANGTAGVVPAPSSNGYNTKFLRADGTWSVPAYPTKSSWNYNDMYVSSLTINGNYLRWVKNGSNNDITIPYATNSDTVDGYHAGVLNGQASIFVSWPSSATMISEGFLTSLYGLSGYGHPDEVYLQAICKWAIAHYTNLGNITLIGSIAPNSSGTCIMHLYSSSGRDSSTLLPRYCSATYHTLGGSLFTFGSVDYTWYYRNIDTNTNTWRGIQNNLTSDSTTDSLSAAQGKALNNKFESYLPLTGGNLSGKLIFSQGNSARDVGIVGTYDPNRAAAIWSMGSAYEIDADGTSLGSLYGAAYAYFGSGYTFGAGYSGGHSLVWCLRGTVYAALGNSVWSRGGFIKNESSDSYVLLGGGGHVLLSSLSSSHTHTFAQITNKITVGNEFNFVDAEQATIWFNYRRASTSAATTATTQFNFGQGTASSSDYAYLMAEGYKKNGSSDSYVLLGGGGHKVLSDFAMSHNHPYLYTELVTAALDNVTWAKGYLDTHTRAYIYNTEGAEYSYLFGVKENKACGTILKIGYTDTYLRILRVINNTWQSTDWEKISAGYADSAGSVAWANVSGKPINFKAYSGSLASGGWETMLGKGGHPAIAISYNNAAASWNSGTYSATLVYGCLDTRGLLDCAHNTPIVTFGGSSYGGSTDDDPSWYMKISGTNGTTYDLNSMPYATSAGKLQTARTIWGQSFDGTGNINGHICVNGYYFMVGNNSENVSTIDNAGDAQPIFGYGQGRTSRNVYYTGYNVNICGGSTWNSTSGITVNASNNVGIGTTSPSLKLDVSGIINCTGLFVINDSSNNFYNGLAYFRIYSDNDWGVIIDKNNAYSYGLDIRCNGDYGLRCSGHARFSNNVYAVNFYTTSDRSKKQNISSFSEHIRKFQLKDTEKWHYGVIAQEVEEMFRDGEEGNMTVNYNSVLSYYIGLLELKVLKLEDKLKKYEDKFIN